MKNNQQLTVRALVLSALGSILITASSMVVALRMSALPWPTVFVSVLSMALLNLLGKSNVNEMNIAQTGMSAGAMVAGGLAFTLPGLWIAKVYTAPEAGESFWAWAAPKALPLLAITLCGILAGSALSYLIRRRSLESPDLPFPIGEAAAETLLAGDSGGGKAKTLFATLGLAGLFTILRDLGPQLRLAKSGLIPETLNLPWQRFPLGIYMSPMAVGIGYLIGFLPTLWWLIGALISHWVIKGYFVGTSFFNGDQAAVGSFVLTAAVGLMVGAGLGILLKTLYPALSALARAGRTDEQKDGKVFSLASLLRRKLVLLSFLLAFVCSIVAGLSVPASLLLLLGTAFTALMASGITGSAGINPMEIFGILVLLAIRIFCTLSTQQAFLVTAAVAVACGFAGDLLNDYKMGQKIGTDPKAQLISQMVGAAVGALVALLALFALLYQHGTVGPDTGLTAAQAFSVTSMVNGIGSPLVFTVALVIGLLLYLLNVPAMIIGIGMILPIQFAITIFLGGLLSFLVRRRKNEHMELQGQLIAAGCLGGEGLISTVLAIVQLML